MHPSIGAYGKIPGAADFVSIGASAISAAFARWLEAENDLLAQKRQPFPAPPVRFLYRDPEGTGAIVGTMGPSQDQVGRAFPLAVFAHVDPSAAGATQFASLPAAYAQFVDAAAALLAEATTLSRDALVARLSALTLPNAAAFEEARTWTHQALEATPGATILQALFGPIEHGVHYHGINMFKTACARFRGHDPGLASVILECPAVDDVQLGFWLTFAQHALGWTVAPPSFAWTDVSSPDHRLLLVLGSPAAGVLPFFADPSAKADRLWPMRTTSAASIDAGRRALGGAPLQALEPPAPTAAALLAGLVAG